MFISALLFFIGELEPIGDRSGDRWAQSMAKIIANIEQIQQTYSVGHNGSKTNPMTVANLYTNIQKMQKRWKENTKQGYGFSSKVVSGGHAGQQRTDQNYSTDHFNPADAASGGLKTSSGASKTASGVFGSLGPGQRY